MTKELFVSIKLPKRLNKEPLIDAIFEMRFSSDFPTSDIIPGFLFSKLEGKKSIVSLPAAQLPKAIREANSNLKFSPTVKLDWEGFSVSIGDHNVLIGCKLPYPGWVNFKSAIVKILDYLKEVNVVQSVNRYSIKYLDLIQNTSIARQIDCLNIDVEISCYELKQEAFQLRMEIPEDGFINVVQLISSTKVNFPDGSAKEGIIIDVDTIFNLDDLSLEKTIKNISEKLEKMHAINKKIFFNCLKPETLESLEPIYE